MMTVLTTCLPPIAYMTTDEATAVEVFQKECLAWYDSLSLLYYSSPMLSAHQAVLVPFFDDAPVT